MDSKSIKTKRFEIVTILTYFGWNIQIKTAKLKKLVVRYRICFSLKFKQNTVYDVTVDNKNK